MTRPDSHGVVEQFHSRTRASNHRRGYPMHIVVVDRRRVSTVWRVVLVVVAVLAVMLACVLVNSWGL